MKSTPFVIIGVGFLLILFFRQDAVNIGGWGFEHPVIGRREYASELECWKDLAIQKDVLIGELYGMQCNQRPIDFWSYP